MRTNPHISFKLWLVLPVLMLLFFILDISMGSVSIPFTDTLSILAGGSQQPETWQRIIMEFRLPRAITAILAGASLGLSGLLMQSFFRNPLAGPFVLGISSGASLGVALMVMAGSIFGGILSQLGLNHYAVVLAASAGAGLVLVFIMWVSLRIRDSMTILIIGLMFGSITGAVVSVLQFFSTGEEIQVYLLWTFGSLGGLSNEEVMVFAIVSIISILLIVFLMKPLNAFLLGENYARSLGIPMGRSRILIIIAASLLAGTTTAFCGPIAFIGIAVPHFARIVFDTAEHKILVPAIVFTGAIILLLCDVVSQLPGTSQVLPLNAVTSLIGAPVVIWVLLNRKKRVYHF